MQTLPKERRFETLSYLPPLSDAQISRQLQYILDNGFIPGVEFSESSAPEQHYWTLWKLPLFNATSTNEILSEIKACRSEYSNCFIRVMGFDNVKQCQVLSFIVHKPNTSRF
ncbi:ribulose bisphosphate carboxylase small subunit [Aerosakkonemataceae cyanobacterium BLCC-F154]|uniref:Ribulose bisphosphate carboxylase small subunit n=1 Tax=Floridaenema fluviatile BLCC-F154 TaxID=3153640 RepID=A0ABV4YGC4_9CYAN